MGEANIPPSDPRAVREGKEKIRKVEETTLYPRISLYELLTKWKSEDEPRKRSEGDSKNEARRHFLDSFAYLCDVEKGGKTVTAAALRSLPNSDETNLLLAANEGIRDEVLRYAKNILSQLKSMPEEDIGPTKNSVFRLAIEKCHERIEWYKDKIRRHARRCRRQLATHSEDQSGMKLATMM